LTRSGNTEESRREGGIFLPGVRKQVVNVWGRSGCADVLRQAANSSETLLQKILVDPPLPRVVVRLNELLVFSGLSPIPKKELESRESKSLSPDALHWASDSGRRVMALMRTYNSIRLRSLSRTEQLAALDELRKALREWREKEEQTPTDYLAQKFYVLFKLFQESVAGDIQERWTADELAALLLDSRLQDANPTVWLHLARRAIVESGSSDSPKGKLIRATLFKSPNPTLVILATLPDPLLNKGSRPQR
jgi:hypothetical protein